jgi:hypothetical protein
MTEDEFRNGPTPNTSEQEGGATNVYEGGQGDARQAGDIKPSRFRPRYRQLTPDEVVLHDAIKTKAVELEALIESVGSGRYTSLALTALEEAVIWSVKQLTS